MNIYEIGREWHPTDIRAAQKSDAIGVRTDILSIAFASPLTLPIAGWWRGLLPVRCDAG
jgi:hypothetical protein